MKMTRLLVALAGVGLLVGLAYVAQRVEDGSGAQKVKAADDLVRSFKPEQKTKALVAFDSKERTNWNFVPLQDSERKTTRKGLPLEEMSAEQKKLALALVRAGTSKMGAEAATTIMSLEAILNEQEK